MQLSVKKLSKSFGTHCVLQNISIDLPKVQGLVLIGPSGGGKSTLLRVLAGLDYPDAGSGGVIFNGKEIDYEDDEALIAHRRSVGTVFQAYNLFPHFTALQNVTLPLVQVHGHSAAEADDIAMESLQRFQLEAHAKKKPAELSGGQRQRVAIARAIAIKPSLLFFDEPTSALDPEMTGEVLEIIEELKDEGRDFVLVTHEMGFARRVAGEVALLSAGRIVEAAPAAQLFEDPQSEVTKQFLAKILKY